MGPVAVTFRFGSFTDPDVRGAQANPLRAVVFLKAERHVLLENGVRD